MAGELEGVRELTAKLNRLDQKTRAKAMRSVLFKATTPVRAAMRSAIPVGDRANRTYRGRLVGPGFAKRSIKRVTGKKYLASGRISIALGVRAEAFYAIRFLDQGPHTITTRRNSRRRGSSGTAIKPYTLRRVPWFESVFIRNESGMLSSIKTNLQQQVRAIANG